MDPITNTILGLSFFLIAVASTLLMFHLWGYPFDHLTHTSAAPAGLVRMHRFLGYAYFAIYVTLMTQMAPRLWSYQIEFPARGVFWNSRAWEVRNSGPYWQGLQLSGPDG